MNIKKNKKNLFFIISAIVLLAIFLILVSVYISITDESSKYRMFATGSYFYYPGGIIFSIVIFISILISVPQIGTGTLKKSGKIIVIICLAIALVFNIGLGSYIGGVFYQSKVLQNTRFDITEITLEELNKIDDTDNTTIIYIGRDDCPICEEVYPQLVDITKQIPVKVNYYNTGNDRYDNTDNMMIGLNKYYVSSVPTVLAFIDGQIDEMFEGDEIKNRLNDYLLEKNTKGVYFIQ